MNQCAFRHSARNFPLNNSMKALSVARIFTSSGDHSDTQFLYTLFAACLADCRPNFPRQLAMAPINRFIYSPSESSLTGRISTPRTATPRAVPGRKPIPPTTKSMFKIGLLDICLAESSTS